LDHVAHDDARRRSASAVSVYHTRTAFRRRPQKRGGRLRVFETRRGVPRRGGGSATTRRAGQGRAARTSAAAHLGRRAPRPPRLGRRAPRPPTAAVHRRTAFRCRPRKRGGRLRVHGTRRGVPRGGGGSATTRRAGQGRAACPLPAAHLGRRRPRSPRKSNGRGGAPGGCAPSSETWRWALGLRNQGVVLVSNAPGLARQDCICHAAASHGGTCA